MTIIGVISDTHIAAQIDTVRKIPSQVWEAFQNVDMILHGGDFTAYRVLVELEAIAPVVAVYGNNDGPEITSRLPATREITIEQCRIGLTHGDVGRPGVVRSFGNIPGNGAAAGQAASHFEDVHCVVFGHSHYPLNQRYDVNGRQVLLFNPGSPTWRRRAPHHSCGLLRVDGGQIEGELIEW